jgi:DNA-binding transcriptional LysR family regulator
MRVPAMRLRHIEIFRALMLTHSVTRAAEELRTSQPTASRFLAELEREIGYRLFSRQGGKLTPTPEAEALFVAVQQSFRGLDHVRRVAEGIGRFENDRLRICSISSFALGPLSSIIPAFHKRHPSVALSVDIAAFPEVVERVVTNQCELGFVAYNVEHKGLEQIHVIAANALCAMPAQHRLADRSEVTIDDLAGEEFVSLALDAPSGRGLERLFQQHKVNRHVVLETQTGAAACSFIKGGMGVSVLDPFTVIALTDARMTSRPFLPPITFEFSALVRADRPMQLVARQFLDDLLAASRGDAGP